MRRVGDGPVSCHRTNKSITNHISAAVNHQRSPGAQDPPHHHLARPLPHTPPLHFASSSLHKTHGDKQPARGDRQDTLISACSHVTNGAGGGHVCPSGSGRRTRRRPEQEEVSVVSKRTGSQLIPQNDKTLETEKCFPPGSAFAGGAGGRSSTGHVTDRASQRAHPLARRRSSQ